MRKPLVGTELEMVRVALNLPSTDWRSKVSFDGQRRMLATIDQLNELLRVLGNKQIARDAQLRAATERERELRDGIVELAERFAEAKVAAMEAVVSAARKRRQCQHPYSTTPGVPPNVECGECPACLLADALNALDALDHIGDDNA